MNILDVVQGTPEWDAARARHFTASEAPAMMGVSKYQTRSELLMQKHTGLVEEVSAAKQALFDRGHAAEAAARLMAEQLLGDLFPITASARIEGLPLLASLDGITITDDDIWEHKLWNEGLAAAVRADNLPEAYKIQMDQQLLVTSAKSCLFMVSDGTPEKMAYCWYTTTDERKAALIAGWKQFAKDLDGHIPTDKPAQVEPGKAPETLPALHIEVTGMVTASNLDAWKNTALTAIRSVNRDLKTDADFADADKAVKWCADVEARLKAAKEHALSQTASIDALFKAIDDIAAESKAVRLDLGKLVDRRKVERKEEAVIAARKELEAHIAALNGELAPMALQPTQVDFAGAIKGLRSFASMDDALATAVANGKISADAQARLIRANAAVFRDKAAGMEFLFADLHALIQKSPDDFDAVLSGRIRKQKDLVEAQEKQRQAEEAARIAAAEQRAREQEAARIAAEQAEAARIEALAAAARITEAQQPQQVLKAEPVMADATDRGPAVIASPSGGSMGAGQATAVAPSVVLADLPKMNLGQINARLRGPSINAAFITDVLGIPPAGRQQNAVLFNESQWPAIKAGLLKHIQGIQ